MWLRGLLDISLVQLEYEALWVFTRPCTAGFCYCRSQPSCAGISVL